MYKFRIILLSFSVLLNIIFELILLIKFLPEIFKRYFYYVLYHKTGEPTDYYHDLIAQYSLMNSSYSALMLLLIWLYIIKKNNVAFNVYLILVFMTIFSLLPKAYFVSYFLKELGWINYLPALSLYTMAFSLLTFIIENKTGKSS